MKEMKDDELIVSKTDLKGIITYTNHTFLEMAEYEEKDLIGKPHNLIRHPDMPKAVFKYLWDTIKTKQEIFAFVLNKTQTNNEYWVFANITASLDEKGNIIGYYSVRRKPNPKAIEIIKPIYDQMKKVEQFQGVSPSLNVLTSILEEKGVEYNELIISLQE